MNSEIGRDTRIDADHVDCRDVVGHVEHSTAGPRVAPWHACAEREIQRYRAINVSARDHGIVALSDGADTPVADSQVVEAILTVVVRRRGLSSVQAVADSNSRAGELGAILSGDSSDERDRRRCCWCHAATAGEREECNEDRACRRRCHCDERHERTSDAHAEYLRNTVDELLALAAFDEGCLRPVRGTQDDAQQCEQHAGRQRGKTRFTRRPPTAVVSSRTAARTERPHVA